jgi:hypothetical protein
LFGGKEFFIKFATRKGVAPICDPEYNELKKLRITLKLNLLSRVLRKMEA